MPKSSICSVPDCGKPHDAKGYCGIHYKRWRRNGDIAKRRIRQTRTIEGCSKRCHSGGLCAAHNYRMRRHGAPTAGGTSPGEPERFYREVVLTYDSDECLIWPFGKLQSGYGHLNGQENGNSVSRLVCEAVHGPMPPDKDEAAHSCGNRPCVNGRHLRWATYVENNADKLIHGTLLRGEQLPRAKLTKEKVLRIRELASEGRLSNEQIGDAFGICRRHVRAIANRECWKHI